MGLNASKTKCLLFKKANPKITQPNIYLQKELLKYEKHVKFLGIIFDENLTFEEHINEVYNKCQNRLNLLKSLTEKLGEQAQILLFTLTVYLLDHL